MAYNYEYPYVDPHVYNDDWLIYKVKDLDAFVHNELKTLVKDYLNTMFVNAVYVPETETLRLYLDQTTNNSDL